MSMKKRKQDKWQKIAFALIFVTAIVFVINLIPQKIVYTSVPVPEIIEVSREIIAEITMYNPTPEQTDSTPDINAMGLKVQEGDVANNCLEFETKVEISGKMYYVRDRMAKKWDCNHFDILAFDYKEALKFGRKTITVKIYE